MSETCSTKTALGILAIAEVSPYLPAADESYLSPGQVHHFEKILKKWRTYLQQELDRAHRPIQQQESNLADPTDRASQEEELTLALSNRDRELKLIKKIDKTLQRLSNDEFGYCVGCGEEIGLRRLEARPTAEMCVDCKTLEELKKKQMQGVSG